MQWYLNNVDLAAEEKYEPLLFHTRKLQKRNGTSRQHVCIESNKQLFWKAKEYQGVESASLSATDQENCELSGFQKELRLRAECQQLVPRIGKTDLVR